METKATLGTITAMLLVAAVVTPGVDAVFAVEAPLKVRILTPKRLHFQKTRYFSG
jgi:hypothetical protein